jgi:hypothetical protein
MFEFLVVLPTIFPINGGGKRWMSVDGGGRSQRCKHKEYSRFLGVFEESKLRVVAEREGFEP